MSTKTIIRNALLLWLGGEQGVDSRKKYNADFEQCEDPFMCCVYEHAKRVGRDDRGGEQE